MGKNSEMSTADKSAKPSILKDKRKKPAQKERIVLPTDQSPGIKGQFTQFLPH
jgi:hypothetical protein